VGTKRLIRITCVLVSNGLILFFGARLLFAYGAVTAGEVRFDKVLGAIACSWCLLGFVAEILRKPWAKRINIALPATVAVFMLSTPIWLPRVTNDGDRFDAALGFAFLAIAPICLAVLSYLAYRKTTIPTQT
jgi:hypothetical protein